eukprot:6633916-Pyramimonas_sp.AAC.1
MRPEAESIGTDGVTERDGLLGVGYAAPDCGRRRRIISPATKPPQPNPKAPICPLFPGGAGNIEISQTEDPTICSCEYSIVDTGFDEAP